MSVDLKRFQDALFARGAELGFTDMETFYQSASKFTARVYQGEVDTYTISEDGGLAFRGLLDGKMGNAYTERIDDSSIPLLLEGAANGARVVDSDEVEPLFTGSPSYQASGAYSEAVAALEPGQLVEFLQALEAACFAADPRVVSVNYCNTELETAACAIANTRGLSVSETVNSAVLFAMVVVKDGGAPHSAHRLVITRDLKAVDPRAMAREIVDEAISFLGAAPVETGRYPILLRNTAAASLLAAFSRSIFASSVQKGKSRLKGMLGEPIASPAVTLLDDPFLAAGAATRSFDCEGVASRPLAVVEDGVLKSFLHNLKTAHADGVAPTGHGHKPSYKGAVGIAPSNLYLRPGARTLAELTADLEEGLIITDLHGLHAGTNYISGDFSLAAGGYFVKDGRIAHPVNQITVAGNFYDLLQQVEEVGADLAFGFPSAGYTGSPTLRVTGLAVTGK